MAKQSVAQSTKNCICYDLKFSRTEWADFKSLLVNATCITADFEANASCSVRTRKRLAKVFYILKQRLESVMSNAKSFTDDYHRILFTRKEWEVFSQLLQTGRDLADLASPLNPPPKNPDIFWQTSMRWHRLEEQLSDMME